MINSKSPPTGVIALVIVAEFGLSVLIKDQVLRTRISVLGAAFLALNVVLWAFWIVIVYPYFRSSLDICLDQRYIHISLLKIMNQ
jgi:threonine/homoserine efflux transporter RhtA